MENPPFEAVFPMKKWWFSIVMLVYQRVMEPLKNGTRVQKPPRYFHKKGGSTHPPKSKGDFLPPQKRNSQIFKG